MQTKSDIGGMDQGHRAGNPQGKAGNLVDGGPSHEEIQKRAYEIHLERGGEHGQDVDDWLQAEQDLKARRAAR
jgi:hypothetical protein